MLVQTTSGIAQNTEQITVSGEISRGARRLAAESADFITAPFNYENNNLFITAGVLGATVLTYSFDTDINHRLKPNQNSKTRHLADIGNAAGNPFIHMGFAAAVYGTGIAADSPKWKQTGEMIGEALILADSATLVLKEATGRGRPNATNSKGDFKPFGFKKEYDSFPSMHTASSFALASVMAATSENVFMKASYYLAASFVGFSRMYKNRHWASDVLFAAALGEFSGRIVTNYHASKERISITPLALENGAGLALVGTW